MPYTLNGFGTSYYGQRDLAEDGSYITTLWVTALWIPLVPLGSYRVRPVGEGTNIIIHSSQTYETVRVPLCWPQVRNVYLCVSPILVLILYFSVPDVQKWWTEDVLKEPSQSVLQPEPPQAQPDEADLPLDSKDAAVACGKVLKLDEAGFVKLNLVTRIAQLVDDSGFTNEEIKEMGPAKDLKDGAADAYLFGFITWEIPNKISRADFDKIIIRSASSIYPRNLSAADRTQVDAYLVKYKRMMVTAFDVGRHDARTSPCPF